MCVTPICTNEHQTHPRTAIAVTLWLTFTLENASDYEVEIGWPIWACYSQETGHTLAMAQQWIWCSVCGMCIGEYIHPLDHLIDLFHMMDSAHARGQWTPDEIAKARQYGAYPRVQNLHTPQGRWTVGDSVAFRNSLETHREWRALRQSPARCLQCGSHEFERLAVNDQYVTSINDQDAKQKGVNCKQFRLITC